MDCSLPFSRLPSSDRVCHCSIPPSVHRFRLNAQGKKHRSLVSSPANPRRMMDTFFRFSFVHSCHGDSSFLRLSFNGTRRSHRWEVVKDGKRKKCAQRGLNQVNVADERTELPNRWWVCYQSMKRKLVVDAVAVTFYRAQKAKKKKKEWWWRRFFFSSSSLEFYSMNREGKEEKTGWQ